MTVTAAIKTPRVQRRSKLCQQDTVEMGDTEKVNYIATNRAGVKEERSGEDRTL